MKKIKFRGKTFANKWVEGCYQKLVIHGVMKHFILPANSLVFNDIKLIDALIEVDEPTICQFTGLTDKNGKEIYEGDILSDGKGRPGVVTWIDAIAQFSVQQGKGLFMLNEGNPKRDLNLQYTEIIGNIHDTPELLKTE